MSIINDLKAKKVIKKTRLSVKVDETLKNELTELCEMFEVKTDDFVNEALKQAIAKESKKIQKVEGN